MQLQYSYGAAQFQLHGWVEAVALQTRSASFESRKFIARQGTGLYVTTMWQLAVTASCTLAAVFKRPICTTVGESVWLVLKAGRLECGQVHDSCACVGGSFICVWSCTTHFRVCREVCHCCNQGHSMCKHRYLHTWRCLFRVLADAIQDPTLNIQVRTAGRMLV